MPRRPSTLVLLAAMAFVFPASAARADIGDLAAELAIGQSSLSDAVALPIGATGFGRPQGVAIDRSVTPNRVYVSDTEYHRVLGWSDVDALVNGAPADIVIGQPDFASWGCNGQAWNAGIPAAPTLSTLCQPTGLAVDGTGSLYVADTLNCRILVFDDPFGGDQVGDRVLGQSGVCDGVTVNAGKLFNPQGVAVDASGNVFVADTLNCRVLEFDGPLTATDGTADRVYGQAAFNTRQCGASSLYFPVGLDVDAQGTLHVGSQTIISSFTNALTSDTTVDHTLGTNLCNPGGESASTTCGARAVAADPNGRLYVLDAGNSRVLRFDTPLTVNQAAAVYGQPAFTGDVTLFHDACNTGGVSATSLCLRIAISLTLGGTYEEAGAVAVDSAGRLYVADGLNHRVLRYDGRKENETAASLALGQERLDDARMPTVPVRAGNITVGDSHNVAVVVDEATSRVLVYGNLGFHPTTPIAVIGQPDLVGTECNGAGLDARSLCKPTAALIDAAGNLWVADTGNNRVLQYEAPWLSYDYANRVWVAASEASRVFGQPDFTHADCTRGAGGLCRPQGVAVDARQNLYVADSGNHRIVHHENPLADGVAERVYGQPTFADAACNAGGLGASSLCDPRGLGMNAAGDLYVADRLNNRVLVYADVFANGGGADRVFGQPSASSAECAAGPSGLCGPQGVALERAGNLLVADTGNARVLVFDTEAGDASADHVLGQPDYASTGCGAATAESLCAPNGVATTRSGDVVLVADAGHQRVVRYDAPYCLGTFRLGFADLKRKGVSQPQSTRLKIVNGRNPATADDVLYFSDKLIVLEDDGTIDGFDTPLLTLSTDTGVVYQEKVPSVSNTRVTDSGGVWETRWLKGERDTGVDDYKITTKFVIPGDDTKPQYDKVGYKGRAVGLDLAGFTQSVATFSAHFSRGSLCFVTDMECKASASGRACKAAR